MKNNETRWYERPFPLRWERTLWLAAVAAMAAGLAVALVGGCEPSPPSRWHGMDRARVACSSASETYPTRRLRCAGEGRMYECVTDDGYDWQCAAVGTDRAPSERAP